MLNCVISTRYRFSQKVYTKIQITVAVTTLDVFNENEISFKTRFDQVYCKTERLTD